MPAPAAVGRERSFAHEGEGLAADRRFVGGGAAWTGGGDGARLHGPQPSSTGPPLASRRQGRPPLLQATRRGSGVDRRRRPSGWRTASSCGATSSSSRLATWVHDLWKLAPTPAKARRVRRQTVERLLKRRAVGQRGASCASRRSRRDRSAAAHVESVVEAADAPTTGQGPDRPVDCRPPTWKNPTRQGSVTWKPRGRLSSSRCLQKLPLRDCRALRCLCGVAPVTRRSGKSVFVPPRHSQASPGRTPHSRATRTLRFALVDTGTPGRASPTASSRCAMNQTGHENRTQHARSTRRARRPPDHFTNGGESSPAACAAVRPQRERTSQVSIIDLAKRNFSFHGAGRIRCVSPVPQPREGVALPGTTAEVHRGDLRQLPGPGEARPRGCCRRSTSSPSSSVNDAEAIAEAASRPTFVAVKTGEQQGWQARSLAAADGTSRSSALQLRRALPT